MGQNRVRTAVKNIKGDGIRRKFMGIDKTTACLVEGIAWQPIVNVELPRRFYRLRKGAHEALNLFLRRLRSGHGVGASQSGKVLTKRMSGNERMKIILLVKVIRIVIPAPEVGARSR